MTHEDIQALNQQFSNLPPEQILTYLLDRYTDKVCLASSLGAEDQVLTHMLCQLTDDPSVFVLDTGRLHQETYDVMDNTQRQYAFNYHILFPKNESVQAMVSEHGPNHFYASLQARKDCCFIRKVEPLQRALKGYDVWITGLRRAQSIDRASAQLFEWDSAHNMLKVNPLVAWSKDDVWTFIKQNDVPYNVLHDQGFPSIGCAPCTRAVPKGEDDRSGRWWWEDAVIKECGLHVNLNDRKIDK
jgi:phosphoadenosine phosphosulfate reductase